MLRQKSLHNNTLRDVYVSGETHSDYVVRSWGFNRFAQNLGEFWWTWIVTKIVKMSTRVSTSFKSI